MSLHLSLKHSIYMVKKHNYFLDTQGVGRDAFGYTNVGPINTDIFKRCHSDRESFKSALGLLACRMVHSYMHMHTNTRGTTLNSILYIYTHYIHVYMCNVIIYVICQPDKAHACLSSWRVATEPKHVLAVQVSQNKCKVFFSSTRSRRNNIQHS